MSALPITLEVQEGIARLTLARPDQRNTMNPQFTETLHAHAKALAARDDVRVVILSAQGPAFCAGGDLDWMAALEPGETEAALHHLATSLHAGVETLVGIDAPILTAVTGAAAGAGLSLVCASDIVLASPAAMFTVAYTAAGLSPDGGSTWYLPRIVGIRRATELILTNERLSAEQAAAIGIVTRVVADDEFDDAVEQLAQKLGRGATRAYGAAKRLLRTSSSATLHDQLTAEADAVAPIGAGHDGREGIASFVAKRRPQFTGR